MADVHYSKIGFFTHGAKKKASFVRRSYLSKGPNYLWHTDSCDKLNRSASALVAEQTDFRRN